MLLEDLLQSRSVEDSVIRNQSNDVCQIRKKVALIFVCQNSGYPSCSELDFVVMDFDEMDVWILRYQRCESFLNDLRDIRLYSISVSHIINQLKK